MKTWLKSSEWHSYAFCGSDSRWITPPENMSEDDVQDVIAGCFKCVVRGECISAAVENESTGIWCAGEFIPEVNITDTPRQAARTLIEAGEIRERLAKTVDDELLLRGEF